MVSAYFMSMIRQSRVAAAFLSGFLVVQTSYAEHTPVVSDRLARATITLSELSGYTIPATVIGTNILVNNEKNIGTARLANDVLLFEGGDVSLNPRLLRIAKDLRLTVIRYPGGQESETYRWGEGTGPVDERESSLDSYGRKYKQYLGILEIARFAEAIGAQLLLTINYSSGTLQEALNLLEFCNMKAPAEADMGWTLGAHGFGDKAPKGYFAWLRAQLGHPDPVGVRYWEIGNEIYFTKNRNYLNRAHSYAEAMKKSDGSIKIGVTADPLLYWNRDTLLRKKPDIDENVIDWLSIHVYSFPKMVPMETAFTSNGRSERVFRIGKDGEYKVCAQARGTQVLGAPEMKVDLDGKISTFGVESERWKEYCLTARLTGPDHRIGVGFTNDMMVPGIGDRNLYVKDVVIKSDKKTASIWNRKRDEYQVLFGSNQAIERQLAWIGEAYPKLKMFITEASPGYGLAEFPFNQTKSFESAKLKSAIWYAGLMNTVFRQRVEILNQFPFNGRFWGFNLVREDGSVSPVYDVMKMYSAHVNNELLEITISSPKFNAPHLKSEPVAQGAHDVNYLDAVASFDKSNNAIVMTVLNRDSARSIGLTVNEGGVSQSMRLTEYTLLTGSVAAGLEASRIGRRNDLVKKTLTDVGIGDITIPAHSVVNLRFEMDRRAGAAHWKLPQHHASFP